MRLWWARKAWLGDGMGEAVSIEVSDGRIVGLQRGTAPPPGAHRLEGIVLPGMANAHSHAFHRALRGRTHRGTGDFFGWREQMYALAERLEPDSYYRLARAVYAEMVVAGYTAVGEFHYLHHPRGGGRYADPNAMGEALRQAAAEAGIHLTLLDACYLTAAPALRLPADEDTDTTQRRFSDGDAAAWAERALSMREDANTTVGAAVHSVRAVPADQLDELVRAVDGRRVLHMHLSEQPAENAACLRVHGCSPTELLARAGALGASSTAVHATHMSDPDIAALGDSGTGVCCCPSTEADLADGIGPMHRLAQAGSPLSLGSDQHAVVDPFCDARSMEYGERLASGIRGRFTPQQLMLAATASGHAALGQPAAGRIERGAPADLVAVRDDSVRTAGSAPEQILFSAAAADVHSVVRSGELIARDGVHERLGDVGPLLAHAIREVHA